MRHVITFTNIDEAKYVGGGMRMLESDVGLWVMRDGLLDAVGARKTPWTHLQRGYKAGQKTLEVKDATGWRIGDQLEIAPTLSPNIGEASWNGYDSANITAINGTTVTLDAPLRFDHPQVNDQWTAEVLNLTRNVLLQGTETGRAHTIFMVKRPQTLKNVELRHMGPRQKKGDYTDGVLGRYALHFHHSQDGSRGSIVENVVIRDCGNHAFVPHWSHGITLQGCISHNTWEDAYWWDPGKGNQTHDVLFDRCVASRIQDDPAFRGYRLAGFNLRHGNGNEVVDCVAFGVQGNNDASGFLWPENSGSEGDGSNTVWRFHRNVSHNNKCDGLFTWQNNDQRHLVEKFVAYHNADNGLEHGAYNNSYVYRDAVIYGNGHAGVQIHAVSASSRQLAFENLTVNGAGLSKYALEFVKHQPDPQQATWVENCTFTGVTEAAVAFTYDGPPSKAKRDWVDVVACRVLDDSQPFLLSDNLHPDSLITVEPLDGRTFELRRADQEGERISQWNARMTVPASDESDRPANGKRLLQKTLVENFTGYQAKPSSWTIAFPSDAKLHVQVDDGELLFQSAGKAGLALAHPKDVVSENVDQRVKFRISSNLPLVGLFARRSESNPESFYGVRVGVGSSRTLEIFRQVDGQDAVFTALGSEQAIASGATYWLRFQVESRERGTDLRAKLWPAGQQEPADWSLEVLGNHERSLRGSTGQFGVWIKQRGSNSRKIWCDDYHATSLTPVPPAPADPR
ncbi:hypothetical protein RMSM_03594 [Rhodopirellula maiorica SM1]|uniref:CEMIP beta-helix domain-containing protein n=2 Tax=Novipirellula TaxID=2795426 RepID=M5RJI0_9BACT|nr:hypothetical protein RMSM_03594 [Rhodopirellula maiorica SM1]